MLGMTTLVHSKGFGRVIFDGQTYLANRLAFLPERGPIGKEPVRRDLWHHHGVRYRSRCVFKRPRADVTSFVSRASGSPPASFLRRPIAASRGASFAERVTSEPEAATYSKTRTARK